MRVYSEVRFIATNGAYSQESRYRIASWQCNPILCQPVLHAVELTMEVHLLHY